MKTYSAIIYDYKLTLQRRFVAGKISAKSYEKLSAKLNEWLAYGGRGITPTTNVGYYVTTVSMTF